MKINSIRIRNIKDKKALLACLTFEFITSLLFGKEFVSLIQECRPWGCWGFYPQILADKLTLSQPGGGGQIMLQYHYWTPRFSDLPTALKCKGYGLDWSWGQFRQM